MTKVRSYPPLYGIFVAEVAGCSLRTYQRWLKEHGAGDVVGDARRFLKERFMEGMYEEFKVRLDGEGLLRYRRRKR